MKAKFKHAVRGFNGKLKTEGLVYCKYNDGALYLARKYPSFEPGERHHKFGVISKNLKMLYESTSEEYRLDINTYAKLHINYTNLHEKLPANNYAIFTKMMWALKKRFPDIDLVKINRYEILENEYPVRTISEAMQTGLLLSIPEAELLDHKL